MQFADSEKEYYSSLNRNLVNIEDLRYDIKNIFLTMSAYVERSTDTEMKEFYRDRMCPLMEGEIEQDEFGYGMELVDLTRISGILLDNSIEECENEREAEGHMIEQKSDKSGHKGRGLKIIRNILEGYPNITLNTLVDKEIFHQTLNLVL